MAAQHLGLFPIPLISFWGWEFGEGPFTWPLCSLSVFTQSPQPVPGVGGSGRSIWPHSLSDYYQFPQLVSGVGGSGEGGSFPKEPPSPAILSIPYSKITGWKYSGLWKSGCGATTGAHVPKCGWMVSSQQ